MHVYLYFFITNNKCMRHLYFCRVSNFSLVNQCSSYTDAQEMWKLAPEQLQFSKDNNNKHGCLESIIVTLHRG